MAKGIAEATTKIYDQLKSLDSEERLRAVKAALTMLGEPVAEIHHSLHSDEPFDKPPPGPFSDKANAWIKRQKISSLMLDEAFHLDNGKVQLILGKAIGKGKRQQTLNTYLLIGIAAYLETGDPAFSDETAHGYCLHFGCYDSPNHSKYVKAFGNKITGSKSSGWKLTAPGLTSAAELLMAEEDGK